MATTITRDATSLTPRLVLGYKSEREARNLIHTVIGRPDPEVTMKAAGLRTGTLEFLMLTLTDALAMESLHTGLGVLTLTDDDRPGLNMSYVASGKIEVELDDETRSLWVVRVDFHEVA